MMVYGLRLMSEVARAHPPGQPEDRAVRLAPVARAGGGPPDQGAVVGAAQRPPRRVLEAVVGLAQAGEVGQGGRPAGRPRPDVVEVAAARGHLAAGVGAGAVPGAHQVGQGGGRAVAAAADVEHGAGERVGDESALSC